MRIIDTHAHLYATQFDKDRDEMLKRAFAIGVEKVYLPNIDSTSIQAMLDLEKAYPAQCFAMMGLHPCSVKENYQEELALVEEWLNKRAFCAVGEIGIDLYWDKTFFEEQKDAFLMQVQWAKEKGLPIVIHSRDSTDVIIELLKPLVDERLRGIFHCFGGSVEQAETIIEMGFLLGIGGVLTFKKSGLAQTLQQIELKHLVLETDAPYLSPVPFRGKRNESAYTKYIVEKLAEVKGLEPERVGQITSENAERLFGSFIPSGTEKF